MVVEQRRPRSIRHVASGTSLHKLKGAVQKKYMVEQAQELLADLDSSISATFREAPDRRRQYLVERTSVTDPKIGREAYLERRLFGQWNALDCHPAAGCWKRIAAFQVNLPAQRQAEGWGEIDLLGVGDDDLPIVIELKRDKSSEPPLKLLLQAAAYGIALQRAWWFLREEWLAKVPTSKPVPTALHPCKLVCVAPDKYWQQWKQPLQEAGMFESLRAAFAIRGLPSTFATIRTVNELYAVEPL